MTVCPVGSPRVVSESGSPDDRSEAQTPTVVLDAHGELDLSTAAELCHEIDVAATGHTHIVVDLADVDAGDANRVRALMGAAREARVQLSDLVIAVRARSSLDRLISRMGAREFLRVVRAD
jgi:anti-anti-sigma factor